MRSKFFLHAAVVVACLAPILYFGQNCGVDQKRGNSNGQSPLDSVAGSDQIAPTDAVDPATAGGTTNLPEDPEDLLDGLDKKILEEAGTKDANRSELIRVLYPTEDGPIIQEIFRGSRFLLQCVDLQPTTILVDAQYYVTKREFCDVRLSRVGFDFVAYEGPNLRQLTGAAESALYLRGRTWYKVEVQPSSTSVYSHQMKAAAGRRTAFQPAAFENRQTFSLEPMNSGQTVRPGETFQVKITNEITGRAAVFLDLDAGSTAKVKRVSFKQNPDVAATYITGGVAYNIGGNFENLRGGFEALVDIEVNPDVKPGSRVVVSLYRDSALEESFKNATEREIPLLVGFGNTTLDLTVASQE